MNTSPDIANELALTGAIRVARSAGTGRPMFAAGLSVGE